MHCNQQCYPMWVQGRALPALPRVGAGQCPAGVACGRRSRYAGSAMPLGIGWQELLVVLAIVLVIFGASRVPEVGRAMGKGIREFRSAVTGGKDEEPAAEKAPEETSEATSKKP